MPAPTMFLSRKVGADRLGAIDFETQTMQFGELVFTVLGAADLTQAVMFALSRIGAPEDVDPGGIPSIFMGAPCLGVNQVSADEAGNFDVYMNYRVPGASGGSSGAGDVLSFSTAGGSARVLSSIQSTKFGTLASYDGHSIGIGAGGDVSGIDVDVSEFDFAIERAMTAAQLSDSYISVLRVLTNHVNVYPMFGADGGEIRFLGADGARASQDSHVTFKFRFSQNLTGVTVGAVGGVSKDGHEYLEPIFEPGKYPPNVVAVLVHQVYFLADLRPLGFT